MRLERALAARSPPEARAFRVKVDDRDSCVRTVSEQCVRQPDAGVDLIECGIAGMSVPTGARRAFGPDLIRRGLPHVNRRRSLAELERLLGPRGRKQVQSESEGNFRTLRQRSPRPWAPVTVT